MQQMGKPRRGHVIIYTDGASRGNPGPAAIGVVVTSSSGEVLQEISEYLGDDHTNNFAEYSAVLCALKWAISNQVSSLELRSDSELMVKQMNGLYKVKSDSIKPLYLECVQLIKKIGKVEFRHIRREFNKEADRLANEALDQI